MKYILLFTTFCSMAFNTIAAQDNYRPTSSQYLTAPQKADVTVPFAPKDTGIRLPVRWGMDVAWLSEQNMRKGINHIGLQNLSLARGSFQTTEALDNDTELTASQIQMLKDRNNVINLMGSEVEVILNEDQEAGIAEYYVKNGVADVDHWHRLIKASVNWIHKNTQHRVVALSPFNEPDFGWGQGSMQDMKDICKAIKEDKDLEGIAVTGGNTLNNDRASEWYNGLKPYVDWGNTHQLAGSFDTYANFFAEVTADGNYAYADELHNVGEAMVGAEYGMKAGIWWGFDSRARGEFCAISNHGSRIAYAEMRDNWTSASVYRDDEQPSGKVKAFIGSSERQAYTTGFLFLNKERAAYYDGQGPTREFFIEMPGGTGYQKGQTNAERVIDITWGEDIQPKAINGTYKVMNKATGTLLTQSGDAIDMTKSVKNTDVKQHWDIRPVSNRIGGDYSFYNITSVNDGRHIDVKNYSCLSGAEVIAYPNETATSNQQWYLEYAGNGFFYIRNRESALYLTTKSKYAINHVGVIQNDLLNDEDTDRQLWRILPTAAACETTAPAQPTGLNAKGNNASIRLEWNANSESDLDGYMIVRAESGTEEWNTIARRVKTNWFVDNTTEPNHTYIYKVKAIDLSDNLSEASGTAEATATDAKGMIARWHTDGNLMDATENMMDAVCSNPSPTYSEDFHASGSQSLWLNGTSEYLQLPYEIANHEEMSISLWVYWFNASKSWVRILDFGNGTDNYMFLTPRADNGTMRLALKNGGEEQQLDCPEKLPGLKWKHVTVTFGNTATAIYVDGELTASSAAITIKPSDIHPLLNYIGKSQFTADPYFMGYVDDIRIYNHALTADEVKAAMEDTANGISDTTHDRTGLTETPYAVSGQKATKATKLHIGKGIKILK